MDITDVKEVARKALESGCTQTAISSFLWDVSGSCQSPRRVSLEGRHLRRSHPVWARSKKTSRLYGRLNAQYDAMVSTNLANAPIWVDLDTRCRQCPECIAHRKRLWRARILAELNASQRSWFGTLTLRPEEHYLSECRSGKNFSVLSEQEKLLALHEANADEITRYWKRVRKNSEGNLRLAMVVEPHKSGLPHYHAVVHEKHGSTVTKATLQNQWTLGFTQWRVVDNNECASWYVAKYLTKTVGARVRASKQYGDISTALAIGAATLAPFP